jgi:hypothetical protein
MKWVNHVAPMREGRNSYKVLVGKPKGKRPFGRSRHRRDNIEMYLGKWDWWDWIYLS